jgi:hypothetical protein
MVNVPLEPLAAVRVDGVSAATATELLTLSVTVRISPTLLELLLTLNAVFQT